ncbi:MAG: AAA family ATPase [candidate division Zixibacteria bacterium]|nr:AAA family ATPase [candidate division Zixibacteria bacterium]
MAAITFFADVLGQEAVKAGLERALEAGRLPHGVLFYGPKGTGKFAAAHSLAKVILCEKKSGCGDCAGCKKTAAMSHPDLLITIPLPSAGSPPEKKKEEARQAVYTDFLEKKRKNPYNPVWKENADFITVSDLQNLQERLSRKPMEADWRVAILVEADRLQLPQGANKLLKTLEEPHKNTLIILIAERPKNLLPTILSRTQKFFFPPLSSERAAGFAAKEFGLSKKAAGELAAMASGSIAKLYFLQKEEELERRQQAWEVLKLTLSGQEAPLFLALKMAADTRKKEEVLSFLSWLEVFLWEFFCLSELKQPERVASADLRPEFEKAALASKTSFPYLAALHEVGKTRVDLERNVNFRLALFWLFARILRAKPSQLLKPPITQVR